ncbi:MAG: glycosyltransferase family 4 protein [Simkaniaceae bacterium]|nr:glycosyltransferase family 4 protein [Simkaniaceae bacterium]
MSRKVCMLIKNLSGGGGLEKYASKLSLAFARKRCDVTIFTTNFKENLEPNSPIKIKLSPLKKFRNTAKYDQICTRHSQEASYDIIFSLDRTSNQTHLRAGNGVHRAFLENRKLFDPRFKTLTARINPINRRVLQIEKAAFESSNLRTLFTNSYMVRKEILTYYNTDIDKIHVVHNGVEWHEMEKDFNDWPLQKSKIALDLDLDPTTYQFLFIGNGYRRKGLIPLLNALAILPMKDFHLSIVGKEKQLSDYITHAKKLGLQNKVTFFGPQKNIRQFYQMSDCLVIPSYYDPFANVTVEALAMGLLVISSKTNGGYEVLKEQNGFVIPNLQERESFADILYRAMLLPKTWIRSQNIRKSIKHLDFSQQLNTIVESSLETSHE